MNAADRSRINQGLPKPTPKWTPHAGSQQPDFDIVFLPTPSWVMPQPSQKVIDAHPEFRYQGSFTSHFQRSQKILEDYPKVYLKRLDGFEYAYKQ